MALSLKKIVLTILLTISFVLLQFILTPCPNLRAESQRPGLELTASLAAPDESIKVVIDNIQLQLPVKPVLAEGRTLVPLRAIFEALGADLRWNGADQSIIATRGDVNIWLQIGSNKATKNGMQVLLDVPPMIVSGSTLVPLRFVSESLGAGVHWEEATRTVIITTAQSLRITPARIHEIINNTYMEIDRLTVEENMTPSDAALTQKQYLMQQPEVADIDNESNNELVVKFKNGYQVAMLLDNSMRGLVEQGLLQNGLPTNPLGRLGNTLSGTFNNISSGLDAAPTAQQTTAATTVPVNTMPEAFGRKRPAPTSDKALIFDVTADDSRQLPALDTDIAKLLSDAGYSVTLQANNAASLNEAAAIDDGQYGVVFYSGHGGIVDGEYYFAVRPWYDLPPAWNSGYSGTLVFSSFNVETESARYLYAIGKDFAVSYWTAPFPGTFFLLDACAGTHPAGLDSLATWTINKGASAWLGWDDNVSFVTGDNALKDLIKQLSLWKTASEAIAQMESNLNQPPELKIIPSASGSVSLTMWRNDPNESAVPDNRDFRKLQMEKDSNYIYAIISWYGIPSLEEFLLLFSTDADEDEEIMVRCQRDNFEAFGLTGTGEAGVNLFRGTPYTTGSSYYLAIPRSTVFGNNPINDFWLFDRDTGDILN
jgi:hypothetical protein